MREVARLTRHWAILSVPREPIWRALNMARGAYLKDFGNTPGHVNHWSQRAFLKMVGETLDIVLTAAPAPSVDTQVSLTFGGDAVGGDDDDVTDPDIDVDYLDDPLEDATIIWPAGATTVVLSLVTLDDDLDEDDEEWTVAIAPEQLVGEGINYDVAPVNSMTVTIIDASPVRIPELRLVVEDRDDRIDEGDDAVFTSGVSRSRLCNVKCSVCDPVSRTCASCAGTPPPAPTCTDS